jgi:hypothetical protein
MFVKPKSRICKEHESDSGDPLSWTSKGALAWRATASPMTFATVHPLVRSGRTVARGGLRMMPTFLPSPYHSVQRVFPSTAERLACRTAPSRTSRWLNLHPAYSAVRLPCLCLSCIGPKPLTPAQSREGWAYDAPPCEEFPLLPQWPSLRSWLCCPSPSTLIRPHAPHSGAHRNFAADAPFPRSWPTSSE